MEANFNGNVSVAIVMCTYNRPDLLRDSLQSLVVQQTDGKFSYEVVIVYSGEVGPTLAVVRDIANHSAVEVRAIHEPRRGQVVARNRAIEEANGEWLAHFDDDQIADPCWLKELMATAREKDSRVVGGALYLKFPHGCQPELSWQCRRMLGESVHWGEVRPYTRKEGPGTGSLLVHRSVFEKVGRFDESFTLRGYDTDFYRRVREAGIHAWFTRYAVAYHVTPHSRLEDEYFRETSLHNGWHFARRDLLEFGQVKTVALLVARLGQATVLHVPRWLIARLSGSKSAILTARVRLWRTQGYTRSALHWLAPRFFSQRRFFSKYEFRADQTGRAPSNSPANSVTNGSRS